MERAQKPDLLYFHQILNFRQNFYQFSILKHFFRIPIKTHFQLFFAYLQITIFFWSSNRQNHQNKFNPYFSTSNFRKPNPSKNFPTN